MATIPDNASVCPICAKTMRTDNLSRHMKTHETVSAPSGTTTYSKWAFQQWIKMPRPAVNDNHFHPGSMSGNVPKHTSCHCDHDAPMFQPNGRMRPLCNWCIGQCPWCMLIDWKICLTRDSERTAKLQLIQKAKEQLELDMEDTD